LNLLTYFTFIGAGANRLVPVKPVTQDPAGKKEGRRMAPAFFIVARRRNRRMR
jgi:hypothetical protein